MTMRTKSLIVHGALTLAGWAIGRECTPAPRVDWERTHEFSGAVGVAIDAWHRRRVNDAARGLPVTDSMEITVDRPGKRSVTIRISSGRAHATTNDSRQDPD